MNTAYLLLGSNMGDRARQLQEAAKLIIQNCGIISGYSSIYETAAWGKTDQPDFLNQALEIKTTLNAKQLIRKVLKTEKQMGRVRTERYGPRVIDIDILLFNDEVHNYHFLHVPHPELQNRRFALLPLHDIAAERIHPVLNKSIKELLDECPDMLEVKKVS